LAAAPDRANGSPASQENGSGASAVRGASSSTPLIDLNGQSAAQESEEETSPETGPENDEAVPEKKSAEEKGPDGLTEEERKEVERLRKRDQEVRAHEQAHKAAGGPYAGQVTFETERGPDGRAYAVSGEVKIDTSEVPNNPQATIRKLETVKRAALAPSQPSSQDRQVASQADAKIRQAQQELREEKAAEEAEKRERRTEATDATQPGSDSNAAGPGFPTPDGGTQPGTLDPGSLLDLTA
jgi:hypothetical protein